MCVCFVFNLLIAVALLQCDQIDDVKSHPEWTKISQKHWRDYFELVSAANYSEYLTVSNISYRFFKIFMNLFFILKIISDLSNFGPIVATIMSPK